MRLALVTQSCDNQTGIGRITLSLAHEFVKSGHEVHLVAQAFERIDSRWKNHQVPFASKYNSVNRLVFRYATPSILKNLHCDIVNSFMIGRGAAVQTAQSCHKAGIEIRKQHAQGIMWRKNYGIFDRIALQDEKFLLRSPQTKRIIAVSALVKNQIIHYYGVEPDRITVVPNGVDVEYFARLRQTVDRVELRKKYGFHQDQCILLFVGNEFDRKGLKCIIESMAQLGRREMRLLVVGADDPNPYQELARKFGVEQSIVFTGKINGPENLFIIADIFVLPTLYEPYGIVILEAMAAGVPIIAPIKTGAVEGFVNGRNGLFLDDPTSVDELSRAIQRMADDDALRQRIVSKNDVAVQYFSWDKIADKTLEVYKQVHDG